MLNVLYEFAFDLAMGVSTLMALVSVYLMYGCFKKELAFQSSVVPRLGNHDEFVAFLWKDSVLRMRREAAGSRLAVFVGLSVFIWTFTLFAELSGHWLGEMLVISLAAMVVRIGMGIYFAGAFDKARAGNASRKILAYKQFIHAEAWKNAWRKGEEAKVKPQAQMAGDFNTPVFTSGAYVALEESGSYGQGAVRSSGNQGLKAYFEPEASMKAALAMAKVSEPPKTGDPVLVVWLNAYGRLSAFVAPVEAVTTVDVSALAEDEAAKENLAASLGVPPVTLRAFYDITGGEYPPFGISVKGRDFVGAAIAIHVDAAASNSRDLSMGWITCAKSAPVLLNMLVFLSDCERQVLNELINPGQSI
ncbi:MAG: hypothetical protein K2Y32_16705 [Candidatus Obscuribacterales bacterium]|nr:hypothetical protein [Candidatus Obscuribacterales bacterium]